MRQDLEMPFAIISDAALVFGQIPNMAEAIASCPENFKQGDAGGYQNLAEDLFAQQSGWRNMTDVQIREMKAVADEKWRYIECWLTSFAPSHEEKIAVIAWCLSLIMKSPPRD